ncbi:MAG: hypothetical protein Q8J90_08650 [Gallionella sp.]|nr:hypothetical protein [Gallionella sp.]
MPIDYVILLIVGAMGIGGGLFLLREARKLRAAKAVKAAKNKDRE